MTEKQKPVPTPGDPRAKSAGRKGGQATAQAHGPEFFSAIGKKGGAKVLEDRGPEYFARISKLSWEKRRQKAP